jgi:hypothetical protein
MTTELLVLPPDGEPYLFASRRDVLDGDGCHEAEGVGLEEFGLDG